MARMLKKLKQKNAPQKDTTPAPPTGKGYLILGIVLFTLTLTIAGWEMFDMTSRAMYVLLTISLGLTYTNRYHGHKLSETQRMLVVRGSFVTIGLAAALFFVELYQRYVA